jgi:protein-S-isoprenylcysteine O-methyltransferase Ste14
MKSKIAFAMLMGIITTGIVSLTLISVNVGFDHPVFFRIWLRSWAIGYAVAVPAILLIGPRVQAVVDRYFAVVIEKEEQVLEEIE